jgi:DNA primase small subunit
VAKELLFDEDRLKIYYNKIFPYQLMFKWLCYNRLNSQNTKALASLDEGISSSYFHNREFSFTLANDVYCRYLCFKTAEQFKETLVDRVPFKIDIGAVFNIPPDRHNAADKRAFVPNEKEMVFDIDMNDYDEVRTCCTGANVCEKCWEYLKLAMIVLTDILSEDFEFTNLLWVFSGRRGIHAWVCDEAARGMQNDMRTAVVSYCNVGVGNEMSGKTQLQHPLHPRLKAIYKKLEPEFPRLIIKEHNLLSQEKHRKRFLEYLPDVKTRNTVEAKWGSYKTPITPQLGLEMWKTWCEEYEQFMKVDQKRPGQYTNNQARLAKEALIFTYLYPRIDANVSTTINHLLKSPWCIHPKTGKSLLRI